MNKKMREILNKERNEPVAHICHVGKLENDGVVCDRCEQTAELAVLAHLSDPNADYGEKPMFDTQMYLCLACVMSLISLALDSGITAAVKEPE